MTWLSFKEAGTSESGKTKVWDVVSSFNGFQLGSVQWFSRWRKYAFFVKSEGLVFDAACLLDIAYFCKNKTELHKGK